jgi:hypothetical protein
LSIKITLLKLEYWPNVAFVERVSLVSGEITRELAARPRPVWPNPGLKLYKVISI